ncbi:MAG TPA: hypothetical protein VJB66_00210 [Candidatus Nanoarchaeia archaeon]|nr:hypothetical protein [Candidatus Nanoarchaeia archaeon]
MKSISHRKAQITIFIIMGIVILFSFIFIFFVSDFLTTEQLEQQRQALTESPFETASIHQFTSFCVEDALVSGLELLGRQGGFIELPSESLLFQTTRIGYGIGPRIGNDPPLYPCYDGQAPAFCRYGYESGVVNFGASLLPQLRGGAFSIEGQLKKHIADYVERCINIDSFTEQAGLSGYSITADDRPTVKIDFLDTDVLARVEYPISIQLSGKSSTTQFIQFKSRVPVRFKPLYDAITDLAQKDASNVLFSIPAHHRTEFFTVNSARENEVVKFAQLNPPVSFTASQLGADDLFIFRDPASQLRGQDYVFQLARKNRAPALKYIEKNPSYLYPSKPDTYDYLAIKGEQITIVPQSLSTGEQAASDPDEDTVQFSYESATLGNGQNFLTMSTTSTPAAYHTVKVIASDGTLADYQDVRVLIDRPLTVDLIVKNHYGQLDTLSPEDPFEFDAAGTVADPDTQSLDENAGYLFHWIDAFGAFAGKSQAPCSQLPSLSDDFPPCGQNIPPIDKITEQTINAPHPRNSWPSAIKGNVELEVTRKYNGREITARAVKDNVFVVPCIMRDTGDNPYPYNAGGNPLTAYDSKHTCCEGNPSDRSTWKIKAQGEVCFTREQCDETGYYLADFTHLCDGKRGNMCGGNPEPLEKRTPLACGRNGMQGCQPIASPCQEKTPWGIFNDGISPQGVWCHSLGPSGCEEACTAGEVVYKGSNPDFRFSPRPIGSQDYKCGCNAENIFGFSADNGKRCMRTSDSRLGTCNDGNCV